VQQSAAKHVVLLIIKGQDNKRHKPEISQYIHWHIKGLAGSTDGAATANGIFVYTAMRDAHWVQCTWCKAATAAHTSGAMQLTISCIWLIYVSYNLDMHAIGVAHIIVASATACTRILLRPPRVKNTKRVQERRTCSEHTCQAQAHTHAPAAKLNSGRSKKRRSSSYNNRP
jgi:hypothetical protein